MKEAVCGPAVTRCRPPGCHRRCRMMPVTRLVEIGEAGDACATTGGTEQER